MHIEPKNRVMFAVFMINMFISVRKAFIEINHFLALARNLNVAFRIKAA
jgi:hypothetical protein